MSCVRPFDRPRRVSGGTVWGQVLLGRYGLTSREWQAELPTALPLWIPASPGFPLAREYGNDDAGGVYLMVQLARCERVSGVPAA